ncbi:MAG: hypothetical protein AAFP24_12585, partial [Pseudomonadota bacterium]
GSAPPTPRWGSAPNPVLKPYAWILFLLNSSLEIMLDNRKGNEQIASQVVACESGFVKIHRLAFF